MVQRLFNSPVSQVHWADLVERENAEKRQKIGFHIGGGWNQELPELYSASRDKSVSKTCILKRIELKLFDQLSCSAQQLNMAFIQQKIGA